METSRPVIEKYRHDLVVELPAEPIFVDADATRLAQVFLNLLTNAAKYTAPEGKIYLHAARETGEAIVSVKDSGAGIPPENIPFIFEMFAQLEHGGQRGQNDGLGIGLSLVRELVEMHDERQRFRPKRWRQR